MQDLQVGAVVRSVRHRRRWTQRQLAAASGVSDSQISRIERGHLDTVPLASLRRVSNVLEIRVELVARWRGGDLDRLLNAAHSGLHESVARWFALTNPGWTIAPEVSFSIAGERGVIDQLAYHPATRTVLVVELKTQIVEFNELLGTLDRKRRLAVRVAMDRGWAPEVVGCLLVVLATRTNERRLAEHATVLRAGLPANGRVVRAWLRAPTGPCAGILLWRGPIGRAAGIRRVRACRGADGNGLGCRAREPDTPTKARAGAAEGGRGMGAA